ncbi:hypothetical protein C8R44DRAFT_730407 [Mycena epipterygia]|nr:hypothetical protein C8R44DRAFT_730407 [Mycena epipterygia]
MCIILGWMPTIPVHIESDIPGRALQARSHAVRVGDAAIPPRNISGSHSSRSGGEGFFGGKQQQQRQQQPNISRTSVIQHSILALPANCRYVMNGYSKSDIFIYRKNRAQPRHNNRGVRLPLPPLHRTTHYAETPPRTQFLARPGMFDFMFTLLLSDKPQS